MWLNFRSSISAQISTLHLTHLNFPRIFKKPGYSRHKCTFSGDPLNLCPFPASGCPIIVLLLRSSVLSLGTDVTDINKVLLLPVRILQLFPRVTMCNRFYHTVVLLWAILYLYVHIESGVDPNSYKILIETKTAGPWSAFCPRQECMNIYLHSLYSWPLGTVVFWQLTPKHEVVVCSTEHKILMHVVL